MGNYHAGEINICTFSQCLVIHYLMSRYHHAYYMNGIDDIIFLNI